MHFNGFFPYKPSIWGYPHFRKPPFPFQRLMEKSPFQCWPLIPSTIEILAWKTWRAQAWTWASLWLGNAMYCRCFFTKKKLLYCVYIHIIYTSTYIHIYIYMYILCVHIYILCVYIYSVYIYILCVYICIYIYVYIYKRVYII